LDEQFRKKPGKLKALHCSHSFSEFLRFSLLHQLSLDEQLRKKPGKPKALRCSHSFSEFLRFFAASSTVVGRTIP